MGNGASAWDQLSTHSAQLLLCDLQPEIVAPNKTIEPHALCKSARVLLEIARLFSLPTTWSVVPEGGKTPELISDFRQRSCANVSGAEDPLRSLRDSAPGRRHITP